MKRILLLLSFCLGSYLAANAQTYSEKAEMYDTHRYAKQYGDPYNPTVAGFASFFIPGLGQMICDETSRGLAFLGGYAGSAALFYYGYYEMYTSMIEGFDSGNSTIQIKGGGKVLLGGLGMLGISIWSIVDAVQVAKVNNMYFRDHYKTGDIRLEVAPYAEPITLCNQVTVPVGLTLKATF